jgi:hypothetical protein
MAQYSMQAQMSTDLAYVAMPQSYMTPRLKATHKSPMFAPQDD